MNVLCAKYFAFLYPSRQNVGRTSEKYSLLLNDEPVSYGGFINLIADDQSFRDTFIRVLQSVEFSGFLFECPAVSRKTLNSVNFEFVVTESPSLSTAEVDTKSFEEHFRSNCYSNVASFSNLGGDAHLVVPCPMSGVSLASYSHLGSFMRTAPSEQVSTLLQVIADNLISKLSSSKNDLWLSTNGNGVSWLHVRLDSYPKYYAYAPFKLPSHA